MTALVALAVATTAFAQAKTYVIDLGDTTNGTTVSIGKNPYGTNYQNVNPPMFTKFFKGDLPQVGDIVEVHYKFSSNVDIPYLQIGLIDPSEAAKWWTELGDDYAKIENIPANTEMEGVIVFKIVKKPVQAISVQFMYDDKINSKLTIKKAGFKTGRK